MAQFTLCASVLIFFLDSCLSLPLQSYEWNNKDTYMEASMIPAILAVSVTALLVLVILSCVCCPHHGLKALGHQNGLPVSHHHNNCLNQNDNTSEFTIFPPPAVTVRQPISSVHDKVTFDPLPEIHTRVSSHIQGSLPPRPAHLSNVLNKRISLHDWFDVPNNSFPRSSLQYLKEVGSGWFGQVVEGEACNIVSGESKTLVIVKILREDASPSEHIYFLHEVRPFRDLIHQNLIHLLGYCLESDPFLVIMEHFTMDLKTYLIQQRKNPEPLQNGLLLFMAHNISLGLQFMHEHGYIHTDLAARNCCVTEDYTVKIGDYGTSIQNFRDDYYCLGDIALPVRWSAPECLHCTDTTVETKETTKEANIWTFGVVLWELLEFGTLPYIELSDEEVLQRVFLEQNYLLEKPKSLCVHKDQLYQIMQFCWKTPHNRPSIQKITVLLNHLYELKHVSADSASFEMRWNALQPMNREHNLPQSTTKELLFENDFVSKTNTNVICSAKTTSSHTESLWPESQNIVSTYYSPSANTNMSSSLKTIRGSTEILQYPLNEDNCCAIVPSLNVDSPSIALSQTSCHSNEPKVENVNTTKKENSNEIIQNLDNNFLAIVEDRNTSLFNESLLAKHDEKNTNYPTLEFVEYQKTDGNNLLTNTDKLLNLSMENANHSSLVTNNKNVLNNTKSGSFNSLNLDTQQIFFQCKKENSATSHSVNDFIDKVGTLDNQTENSTHCDYIQMHDKLSSENKIFDVSVSATNNPFFSPLCKSYSMSQSSENSSVKQEREGVAQKDIYPESVVCEELNLFTHSNLNFAEPELFFKDEYKFNSNSMATKNNDLILHEDESENSLMKWNDEAVKNFDGLDRNHANIKVSSESKKSIDNTMPLKTVTYPGASTEEKFLSNCNPAKGNNFFNLFNSTKTEFHSKCLLGNNESEKIDLPCISSSFASDEALPNGNSQLQGDEISKISSKTTDTPVINDRNTCEIIEKNFKDDSNGNMVKLEESYEDDLKSNKVQICELSHNFEEDDCKISLCPVNQHELNSYCEIKDNLSSSRGKGIVGKSNEPLDKITNETSQTEEYINVIGPYDMISENETSERLLNIFEINLAENNFKDDIKSSSEASNKTQSMTLRLNENVLLNISDKGDDIKNKECEVNCMDETQFRNFDKIEYHNQKDALEQNNSNLKTSDIKSILNEKDDAPLQQVNEMENITLNEKLNTSNADVVTWSEEDSKTNTPDKTANYAGKINYFEQNDLNLVEISINDEIGPSRHNTSESFITPSSSTEELSKASTEFWKNSNAVNYESNDSKVSKNLFNNNENNGANDLASGKTVIGLHSEIHQQNFHIEETVFPYTRSDEIALRFNTFSSVVSPQSEPYHDFQNIMKTNNTLKTEHNISLEQTPDIVQTKVCFTVEDDDDDMIAEGEKLSPKLVSHCTSYQDNLDYDDVLRVDTETNEALLLDSSESIIGFVPTRSTELLQEQALSAMTIKEMPSLPDIPASTMENTHFLSLASQNLENLSPSSSSAICSGSEDELSLTRETPSCYLHTGCMPNSCEHAVAQNIEVIYHSEDEIINVEDINHEDSATCIKNLKQHDSVSDAEQEGLEYEEFNIVNLSADVTEDVVVAKEVSKPICWSSNESLSFENNNTVGVIIEGKEILAGDGVEFMGKHEKISLASEITSDLEPELNSETSESAADDPSPLTPSSGSEPESPGRDMYTPDFDSDSDETTSTGTSCSSTSGSFECLHNKFRPGTTEEMISKTQQNEASENSDHNDTPDSSPLKVFSGVWDRHATPTRSSMKSPEKKVIQMKKSVSFHEEDPPFVFSYPPASDGSEDGDDEVDEREFIWHLDYTSYADWELQAGDDDEIPENIVEAEDGDLEENEPLCYKSLPLRPLHGSMLYTITGFSDEDFDPDSRTFSQFAPDISKGLDYDSFETRQFISPQFDNHLEKTETLLNVSELSEDYLNDSKYDEEHNDKFSSLQHSFEFHNTSLEVNYSDSSDEDDSEEINFAVDEEDELIYDTNYTQNCKYSLPLQYESHANQVEIFNNNKLTEENMASFNNHEMNLAQENVNFKPVVQLDNVDGNNTCDTCSNYSHLLNLNGENELLKDNSTIVNTEKTVNINTSSEILETKDVLGMKCDLNVEPSENNLLRHDQRKGEDNDTNNDKDINTTDDKDINTIDDKDIDTTDDKDIDSTDDKDIDSTDDKDIDSTDDKDIDSTDDKDVRESYTMERADSLIEEAEAFLLSESFRHSDTLNEMKTEQVLKPQYENKTVLEDTQELVNSITSMHPFMSTSHEILDEEKSSVLNVNFPPFKSAYMDKFKNDSFKANSDNASLLRSESVSQCFNMKDHQTPAVNSVTNSSLATVVPNISDKVLSNPRNQSACVDSQNAVISDVFSEENSTAQEQAHVSNQTFSFTNTDDD